MKRNNKSNCCICCAEASENGAILAYGSYGIPRLLCPECEKELESATKDRDPESIRAAMKSLGEKMTATSPDDLTIETLNTILSEAGERARAIENGEYDFSEDEEEEEAEEREESADEAEEEEETEKEETKASKIVNRILDIAIWAIIGGAIIFVGYRLISSWLL